MALSGNDANPCTETQPCRSLQGTSDKLRGGDVLYVRGGTYDDGEVWVRNDRGASDAMRVVIKAYPGETPLLVNGSRPLIVQTPYVTISGLTFRYGKSIVVWPGSDGARIENNTVRDSVSWAAISLESSNMVVINNTIDLAGNTQGTQGHGIYLEQGDNNQIIGNRVSGMSGYGIHVFDQRRSAGEPPRVISNVIVADNICFNSRERAGIIVAAQADASARNISIYRNIVYNTAGDGIRVIAQVSDVKVHNNTIYHPNTNGLMPDGQDGIYVGDALTTRVDVRNNIIYLGQATGNHIYVSPQSSNITGSNNLFYPTPGRLSGYTGTADVAADPLFSDPAQFRFELRSGSPAIDTGTDVGLPHLGAASDRGALEFRP